MTGSALGVAKPLDWRFTPNDLNALLDRLANHETTADDHQLVALTDPGG